MIFNLLSSIKNGFLIKKAIVQQKNTKQNRYLLNLLVKEGFIRNYKILSSTKINIYLKYKNNQSVIKTIKSISKPSKKIYIKNKELYKTKHGIYILSTSFGFITDYQAKKLNVGGELICTIS